jgi:hypothetical protein
MVLLLQSQAIFADSYKVLLLQSQAIFADAWFSSFSHRRSLPIHGSPPSVTGDLCRFMVLLLQSQAISADSYLYPLLYLLPQRFMFALAFQPFSIFTVPYEGYPRNA